MGAVRVYSWMNGRIGPVLCVLLLWSGAHAQAPDSLGSTVHRDRLLAVSIGGGAVIAGTLIALDRAWYADYERSSFHTFNDGDEWLQMDKAGHFFSSYTVGRWGHGLLRWTGVNERTSTWVGGSLGFAYLTAVEVLDGTSAEWGFSWWDMAANAAGTALFIGQQLGWKEQRIVPKFSAHLTPYAEQRPDLLGETTMERILKDYNGQTYWLSANLHAFMTASKLPPWLNLAVGYGAEGMTAARPPYTMEADGSARAFRQFYLSPDLALTRIPTKSKVLRTLLFVLDCVKVPAPTLEFSEGGVKGHWIYF